MSWVGNIVDAADTEGVDYLYVAGMLVDMLSAYEGAPSMAQVERLMLRKCDENDVPDRLCDAVIG